GVYSGIDFLRNMELTGQKYDFSGKKVAVIGGGNTAMDCCRTALRCGASKVYIIYRRTEKEMPANPIEIHESKLEGVEYMFLTAPAKVNVNGEGKLNSLSCYKMELGEPDASGRRRPIKVDGSEFNVELDIILAAIGQKTDVNFIDDINNNSDEKLVVNKWGDIDADKKTLQTSIKTVFACGDGVTGPATLIEAIAQGRKAAKSCHQLLSGLPITGEKYEFISKRDNFEKQIQDDYIGKYGEQLREEMPTLDPAKRSNFYEVELGYSHDAAHEETKRCLECGCAEYYTCDLKKYSTDYEAAQNRFDGEFKKYDVDFRHPFIEIDNNKCILCSRCIRICKDVVGANALGLVNRGFESYVAPSLGESLLDTDCESCGMCISTCPTGAITENFKFKLGPLELDSFETICNYCSVGCAIRIHHKNGFVMKVTGASGEINKDENICRFPKFGYRYLNDGKRITKPLFKVNGKFEETTFDNAFDIIKKKIESVKPDENAFFAGARLTNEELFLVRKLSTTVKSDNISSFHYLNRGEGYVNISDANVPFSQITDAGKIYLLGSEINYENPVVGYMVNNASTQKGVKISVITDKEFDRTLNKADNVLNVKSYFYFIKAVNQYILSNGLENSVFINDRVKGFDEYRKNILSQDFNKLIKQSGVTSEKQLIEFIEEFNNEPNAILIFAEKNVSSETAKEIFNLMLITGKLGKTSSGLISLKEKNNSQGLFDMGFNNVNVTSELLNNVKNLFIFGEDPLGCAYNKDEIISTLNKSDFKVVQDFFITDTALLADLILPASYPFEIGGSYSNTQKFILNFDAEHKSKLDKDSLSQLIELMVLLSDSKNSIQSEDISLEIASMLKDKVENKDDLRYSLTVTAEDSNIKLFDYGCDYLTKRFEEYFEKQLAESKELVN
ncbi:MAG: molybdopterin-dependent oxidoreductase, partial [Candidatus Kapaibacterium sp.]